MSEEIQECVHNIVPASACSLCKNRQTTVYLSEGGMKYHATPDCSALAEGQRQQLNPSPIRGVTLGSSELLSRNPCRTCRPPKVS